MQVEEKGESFYNPYLASLVEEMTQQGVADDSDGAKVWLSASAFRLLLDSRMLNTCEHKTIFCRS